MLAKPMEDARKLPDVIGFGPCGVSMRLTLAITWPQGGIGERRAHVAAAQVNGDVRSQSLNFSKYAGSTS
jgi:hypothetical protein